MNGQVSKTEPSKGAHLLACPFIEGPLFIGEGILGTKTRFDICFPQIIVVCLIKDRAQTLSVLDLSVSLVLSSKPKPTIF